MRRRPTHATVVAYLALFVALGGSAYAVSAGTIGSRELRDNDVRGKDIRNRTIQSRDVNQRSLAYAKPYIVSVFRPDFPNGADRSVRVLCRGGDVAVSGGTDGFLDFGSRSVGFARPVNSKRSGALRGKPVGWDVRGRPVLPGQSDALAAYAVCLPVARR